MSASALSYTLVSDIPPLPTFFARPSAMKLIRKSLSRKIRFHLDTYRARIDTCKRCAEIDWIEVSMRTAYYGLDLDLKDPFSTGCKSCHLLARWRSEICGSASGPLRLYWFRTYKKQTRESREGQGHAHLITLPLRDKFIRSVFSFHEDSIPPALVVSRTTSSEAASAFSHLYPKYVDITQVKRWIHACETEHDACRLPKLRSNISHLRLIDCELGIVVPAPHQSHYVALSYVWGQQNTDLREEEPNAWGDLPKTINDALRLTQQLGYRYLWVDRYCIDQENAQHKHTQIAQMGDIYAMAAMTIIAAAGDNPAHGLPGLSSRPRRPVRHLRIGDLHISLLPRLSGHDIVRSTWASRAWTFQEGFLSRRRLIFTDIHVSFVCNANHHLETEVSTGDRVFNDQWLRGWQPRMLLGCNGEEFVNALVCLEAYSARKLSYDRDALNAISGALNTLTTYSIGHLWGVPLCHSLTASEPDQATESCFAIIWQHRNPCRRRPGFPSWSPLGWDGVVNWNLDVHSVHNTQAFSILIGNEIRSLADHHVDVPTDHALVSQYLRVNAEIADLRLVGHDPMGILSEACIILPVNGDLNLLLQPRWDIPITQQDAVISGILLTVTHHSQDWHFILLLRKYDEHYERVGIADICPTSLENNSGQWATNLRSDNDLIAFNDFDPWDRISLNECLYALPAIDPQLLVDDLWLRQQFRRESILLR